MTKPWRYYGFGGTNLRGEPWKSDAPDYDRRRDGIAVAKQSMSPKVYLLVDTPHLIVLRHKDSARLAVYIHDALVDD